MSYNKYPKGSDWRKWDLHVHTPASFHWKGGKQFRNMSIDEIETALQSLYETIENSEIAVFCFMDYWTFDGYLRFREFLKRKDYTLSKAVFPGMELRIEAPVDYRLNIHVILSEKLTEQQLIDFKSRLIIRSINRQISDEAIISFAKTLDKSKAKKHGFLDPETLAVDELLKLGSMTIEITKGSLENAFRSIPTGCGYIIMPYDTSDGLKNLDWATQPHADNYFMQSSHVFESRDDSTIELFLGIRTQHNNDFIDNFQKTLGNTPKPVICGSDAHRFSDYGKYPNNKITWIKADPTFEGFKQILYEPADRVKVQQNKPEEKTPYLVIDKVRFIDKTQRIFSPAWIELSQNLNVIIGGKSSGKTLLLYHVAKAIAPELVAERTKELVGHEYELGEIDQFDFEVFWRDGYSNTLGEQLEKKTREISYIPQLYINHLAEKKGERHLIELIESILEQNENFKTFIDQIRQSTQEINSFIASDIITLLSLRDDARKLINDRKEIGEEKAIKEEIKRLESVIEKLRKESGFSEEENRKYEDLVKSQQRIESKRVKYINSMNSIQSIKDHLDLLRTKIEQSLEDKKEEYGHEPLEKRLIERLHSTATQIISAAFSNLIQLYTQVIQRFQTKIEKLSTRDVATRKQLEPFQHKIKNRSLLTKLSKDLDEQLGKIQQISKLNNQIQNVIERGKRTRDSLFRNYAQLFDNYKRIKLELDKPEYRVTGDNLEFNSSISFDKNRFSASFSDLFDRRGNFAAIFGDCFDSRNEFIFRDDRHLASIRTIFEKISSLDRMELRFKSGVTSNEAFSKLFDDYFKIDYVIEHKGEDILRMSPGKRGLVLLQLILHISNARHPIFIDQPEDNLDNRTIYNELKGFVKAKKCMRQIILVTHNANLVVSTDSENVIVSNQAGQQIGKDNKEYQFEYVTGALEHNFTDESANGILYKYGIREHVCDILEGGKEAFLKREQKYGFK